MRRSNMNMMKKLYPPQRKPAARAMLVAEIREAEGLAAFANDPGPARKLLDDLNSELAVLDRPETTGGPK